MDLKTIQGELYASDLARDLSSKFNINPELAIWLIGIFAIWALLWKVFGLWKSSQDKKIIWFITFFFVETLGLIEIAYIFFFSKIKEGSFFKIYDKLLKISGMLLICSLFSILLFEFTSLIIFNYLSLFLLGFGLILLIMFSLTITQLILERKDLNWFFMIVFSLFFFIIVSSFITTMENISNIPMLLQFLLLFSLIVSLVLPIIYYLTILKKEKNKQVLKKK
ncbi:MAG: DUF5652 family protein [Candidatus Pacearchaeota archaeon]|jgi:hypothetical protein